MAGSTTGVALPRGPLTDADADRLRKRDSLPTIPAGYARMVELLGEERTIKFARSYGGERVGFPERPRPDHDMVGILGAAGVALMRLEYVAEKIKWPSAIPYITYLDARALRKRGRTVRWIARHLRRDRKTIERYCKGVVVGAPISERRTLPRPAPELPLFPWILGRSN